MPSRLHCLSDERDADQGGAEPPPCKVTVHAVLDLLEAILKERCKGGATPLRLDDIREVVGQLKQTPGHLAMLYEEAEGHCRRSGTSERSLSAAARSPAAAAAKRGVGRLQTIGLRGLRDELGARWEAVAEQVRATAKSVIRRSLEPSDSFFCSADGDFIICFSQLTGEPAWLKAKAIELGIRERLVGTGQDGPLEHLELEFETLADIAEIESETHDLLLPSLDLADEKEVAALVAAKLDEAGRAIRDKLRDHLKSLEETWAFDLREVQVASGAPARLMIAEPNNQTRMLLDRLRTAARADSGLMASIDLLALGAAGDVLSGDTVLGDALLAVEIHASTLMRRNGLEVFRGTCQDTAKEVRDRLVLLVGAVPRDAYAPSLTDTLRMLKGCARVTALRLPGPRLGGLDLRAAGVPLVWLSHFKANARLQRAPKSFDRFLQELHGAGARLLVDQVADEAAVEPLVEAGIELWSKAGA